MNEVRSDADLNASITVHPAIHEHGLERHHHVALGIDGDEPTASSKGRDIVEDALRSLLQTCVLVMNGDRVGGDGSNERLTYTGA